MSKQITLYIDKGEVVDGEVVEEKQESCGFWDWLFSAFPKSEREPLKDNGRQYDEASGEWEYTAEAGNANPYECGGKIIEGYGVESATDAGL